MSDQAVKQARENARQWLSVAAGRLSPEGCTAIDALIAAVRADTLRQVEQEARRLSEQTADTPAGTGRFTGLRQLADWCQQQREGR